MTPDPPGPAALALDPRTAALVRLAALIALDAPPRAYRREVAAARAAGASVDEVVDTVRAVGPSVGLARAVSAAPGLAAGVGFDLDRAFEVVDEA